MYQRILLMAGFLSGTMAMEEYSVEVFKKGDAVLVHNNGTWMPALFNRSMEYADCLATSVEQLEYIDKRSVPNWMFGGKLFYENPLGMFRITAANGNNTGAEVMWVDEHSDAYRQGVREGLPIVRVGGEDVTTLPTEDIEAKIKSLSLEMEKDHQEDRVLGRGRTTCVILEFAGYMVELWSSDDHQDNKTHDTTHTSMRVLPGNIKKAEEGYTIVDKAFFYKQLKGYFKVQDGSRPDVGFIKNLIDEKMVPEEVKFPKDPFCMGLDIKAANKNGTGAKVTSVEAGSEAAAKGVRVGLPIVEINGCASLGDEEIPISQMNFEQKRYATSSIHAEITSGTNLLWGDNDIFVSITFGGSKHSDLVAFWKKFVKEDDGLSPLNTFVKEERMNLMFYQNTHKLRKNSFLLHVARNKQRLADEEPARKEREQMEERDRKFQEETRIYRKRIAEIEAARKARKAEAEARKAEEARRAKSGLDIWGRRIY